ncbi:LOW QUALITY PROTEIN: zona pellucida-binding protein 1 [Aegotheles albertisi]
MGIDRGEPGSGTTADGAAAAADVSPGFEDVKASPSPPFSPETRAQSLALRLGKPRRCLPRPGTAGERPGRPRRSPRPAAVGGGNGRAGQRREAALGPRSPSPSRPCPGRRARLSQVFPIQVYVKLNHNSPRILCLTNQLNLELIDPIFQWSGPAGGLSSENSSVQISPTGTLVLRHFNLSGVYTCSIVYKLTAMQPDKNLIIKYLIYAYSDPKNYYVFTAQYHAAPCNSSHNASFEKALLRILSKLVGELSCEVTLITECHHVKMQKAALQNEIFFTFSDSEKKNNYLFQFRQNIERFFKQQVEAIRKSSEPLSEIYYIEGTLQTVLVDRCYPGYEMNAVMHPDCPACCVECSPGSYNPSNGTHCLRCDSS